MQENIQEKVTIEVTTNQESEKKPTNKKMTIFNFILIISICVGLLVYMIVVDGVDNMIKVLFMVDYKWVLAGLGCLLLQWFCDGVNLNIAIKKLYPDQKLLNSLRVAIIGQLFNNITPFSTGGQPMQAYELSKTGKRVSDSLSAMMMKFVINQTALVVSTIVVMAFEIRFFINLMQNYLWVAILGFSVNIFAIIIVFLAGVKKGIIIKISEPIVKFLGKIHIIKRPEEKMEKLRKSIDNFSEQFKVIKSEKKMVAKMFCVSVVQSMAYYAITYMVYRAFGNTGTSFWQIIPAQAFLLLIMTFVPTPGSGLGAEGGFYLLFNSIFKEGTINMSILFWRIYTFYLPILVGTILLIPVKKIKLKNKETKTEK